MTITPVHKMKLIKYINIYTHLLTREGLGPVDAAVAINKVRRLPRELKLAVLDVLDGTVPQIEYHGVTLQSLIDDDRLAPVRAILMLDWIRREPAVAMRYMEIESHHAPQQISDDDRAMLQRVLQKLDTERKASSDTSKDDIEISD